MKRSIPGLLFIFSLFLLCFLPESSGQDPARFNDQIEEFSLNDREVNYEGLIVFTGSSSVRFWPDLEEEFPGLNVINRGFGGSLMSDLLYFVDQLILQYRPVKVFIYEGDNDIFFGKSNNEIMEDARAIVSRIKESSPETEIFFISPKPSVARWELKDQYIQLNYKMGLWAMIQPQVEFIDVWNPMCEEDGQVITDIFIDDQLHMNAKGYEIWKRVIEPYVLD